MQVNELLILPPEVLMQLEIDRIEFGKTTTIERFLGVMNVITRIREAMRNDLLSLYLLTGTQQDPLLNPNLPTMGKMLFDRQGRKFYIMTRGGVREPRNILKFVESLRNDPELFEKICFVLDVKHFDVSRDFRGYLKTLSVIISALYDLVSREKIVISPIYYGNGSDSTTRDAMQLLIENMTGRDISGLLKPVILTENERRLQRVEPTANEMAISIRPKRHYTGMITNDGELLVSEAFRGMRIRQWQKGEVLLRRRATA